MSTPPVAILRFPFRIFFVAGASFAALVVPLWLLVWSGAAGPALAQKIYDAFHEQDA